MIDAPLRARLEARLGSAVRAAQAVSGGDVNRAHRVELADGRTLFVKYQPRGLPGMFGCEAAGLGWLREAGALRVPDVVGACDEPGGPAYLALEWIASGSRARDYDERLGRGLAALHRAPVSGFGFEHDNYLATLAQANASRPSWPEFYVEQRLAPQLELAAERGLVNKALRAGFERLFARMTVLAGPPEPPARLHGDLWGGNAMPGEQGEPVLIDPAVYGGHREIDLAMMQLFGGFGPRCFAAYDEAYLRAPGHAERVPLYQLYPLLAHVNLFGGGYVGAVERALARLL